MNKRILIFMLTGQIKVNFLGFIFSFITTEASQTPDSPTAGVAGDYKTRWMLGTKLRSSPRTASVLNP